MAIIIYQYAINCNRFPFSPFSNHEEQATIELVFYADGRLGPVRSFVFMKGAYYDP